MTHLMAMTRYLIIAGIIGALFTMPLFCQPIKNKAYDLMLMRLIPKGAATLSVAELKEKAGDVIILDAREKREYEVSHLRGARWVGYDDFDLSRVKDLPKDTPIVVYCSVGYRSGVVANKLLTAGFENVENLYGGIFEWKNRGYPVYRDTAETDSVHAYNRKWGIWLQKGKKVYD